MRRLAPSVIPNTITRVAALILYVSVNFRQLVSLGQAYPWPRPQRCLRCHAERLWSHGYVRRYFDEVPEAVIVKRFRCPNCRAVYTLRPLTHWRGFWTSASIIRSSLTEKLIHGRWLSQIRRQRQQYWWRGLRMQQILEGELKEPLALFQRPLILATHSLNYREVWPFPDALHRIFAFTPSVGGP